MPTKQTPSEKKVGRPPKDIDEEEVIKLARIGCTYDEIASIVGVSKSTLSARFRTEITKAHEGMRKSLRRMQMESAAKGNVTMQIWLGKQVLGQADKSKVEATVHNLYDKDPIEWFRSNGYTVMGRNGKDAPKRVSSPSSN